MSAKISDSHEWVANASVPLWRRWLPYVVAAALVGWVLTRVDFQAFFAGLAATNYFFVAVVAVVFTLVLLPSDCLGTAYVYRRVLGSLRYRDLLVIRGASYLPSLINHHIGQAWITYYLSKMHRTGLQWVAGGTLLVYATTLGCVVAFAGSSLLIAPAQFKWLMPTVAGFGVAAALYLVVIWLRPGLLARRQLLAPLFRVGVWGNVTAFLLRVPHMTVLLLGTWAPFELFGLRIPLAQAMLRLPPLMVAAALPVTPMGLGTGDAVAASLLVDFGTGTHGQRCAVIAAATLVWAVSVTLTQLPLSLFFLHRAQSLLPPGRASQQPPADRPGR